MGNKVYIVGTDWGDSFYKMFTNHGWEATRDLLSADLIQFTGGEDVSPCLYGEEKHQYTDNELRRDVIEAGYYQVGKLLGKKMAGVCRGGQFLNVMNGGKMYQHVDGHAISHTHKATLYDGTEWAVTSTHHQMMRVAVGGKVLLTADECTYKQTDTMEFEGNGVDCEAIFYEQTNSLCYQPHPEIVRKGHECQTLYFQLIKDMLSLS